MFLRLAGHPVAAAGLADALVALRSGLTNRFGDPVDRLFHDEELDGPSPHRVPVSRAKIAEVKARLGLIRRSHQASLGREG